MCDVDRDVPTAYCYSSSGDDHLKKPSSMQSKLLNCLGDLLIFISPRVFLRPSHPFIIENYFLVKFVVVRPSYPFYN